MVDDNSGQITFGKQNFVGRVQGAITETYSFSKEIGAGGFGTVFRVEHQITGVVRACKQLVKSKIPDLEQLNQEIDLLVKIDHPNIIKLFEVYEDDKFIYLVMEECSGGNLYERTISRFKQNQKYTESEVAVIFKQIMSAVAYLHAQKICHRDIKPENILFLDSSDDSLLKVIDFGLSAVLTKKNAKLSTFAGSLFYMAPEVVKGSYDEKCDIWSCGVILYEMLSGMTPFDGKSDQEILKKISSRSYELPDKCWKCISSDAKDLIKKIFVDASKRPSAEQVLAHDWVLDLAPNSSNSILNINLQSLQHFLSTNYFKKAALTYIASRLKDDEIGNLKNIFEAMDTNGDGTISLEEFMDGLSQLKQSTVDISSLSFMSIDTDKSGSINYTELLAATIDKKQYMKKDRIREAFNAFDTDGNGAISKRELQAILQGENISEIDTLIEQFDLDGDGEINFDEFISMMKQF